MKIQSGKRYIFKRKESSTPEEYLEAVLGAEKYIRCYEQEGPDGNIFTGKRRIRMESFDR